jgi:UDP-perosamine 4-acetyltransferase
MNAGSAPTVIIGAGRHALSVIAALRADPRYAPVAALDIDARRWGAKIAGVPILGEDALLARLIRQGVRHFAVGVGGIADNAPRRAAFERAIAAGLRGVVLVHPSAILAEGLQIGPASFIGPGAIVNSGVRIGRNTIVNTGVIIEHDVRLGDHVHVASGAVICGGVHVGVGAHIGAGATVRQYLRIGAGALVALGSAVVAPVGSRTAVGGVPARPIQAARKAKS